MGTLRHSSSAIPLNETNGTVAEVLPGFCRVKVDDSETTVLCTYRRAQVFNRAEEARDVRERTPVGVGDRVKVQILGSKDGVVEGVAERRNQLSRLAPGRDGVVVQVIATNIDQVVIVAAVRNPEFTAGIVDRFLVGAQATGIPTLLVINKADLLAESEKDRSESADPRPWQIYKDLGVEVIEVSVKHGIQMDALRALLDGKLSVFCGHSGVGKTSLLKVLLQKEVGRVGDLNASTGRGKHTTTSAVLLEGPGGLRLIDTPGVREFTPTGIDPETLASYFPDLASFHCATPGCLHENEQDCRAKEAARYSSYARILESLREEEERQDPKNKAKAGKKVSLKPGRKSLWR